MSENKSEIFGYASVLQEVKDTDPRTGLLTRTHLYKELLKELARCERYGTKMSLMSLRITGAGYDVQDSEHVELMDDLGSQLAACVRSVDYAARWSENQYLVVLPETDLDGARLFAKKVETSVTSLLHKKGSSKLKALIEVDNWVKGDDMPGVLSKVGL